MPRFRMTIVGEYEAHDLEGHYGTKDPKKAAQIDQNEAFSDLLGALYWMEDDSIDVHVEVVD